MSVQSKSEKAKQYQMNYKVTHRENHAAYMKDYVANSPTIQCPCGGRFKMYCAYKHNRTSKHVKFLETSKQNAEANAVTEHTDPMIAVVVEEPTPTKPKSKKIIVEEMFHVKPTIKEVVAADFIDTEQLGSLLTLKPKKKCPEPNTTPKKRVKKVTIQEGELPSTPVTDIHNICA